MNENPNSPLPPSGPEPSPLAPPPRALPGFWGMFGLGIVLIILSCISAAVFQSPFPFLLGAMAAVASVFFRGYRGIFVGYASTIGVVLLAVVILCGTGIIPGFHE